MKKIKQAVRHRKKRGRSITPPSEQAILQELVKEVKARCDMSKALCDENFQADINRAIDLANTPEYEEAIAFIDELIAKFTRMPKAYKAYLYYLKAFTLQNSKGDYPEALLYYNRAISYDPNPDGKYYYDRGILRGDMGDTVGRDEDYGKFDKLKPDRDSIADWLSTGSWAWVPNWIRH
jgi:tetratricopeptide (TPR) repeat protein